MEETMRTFQQDVARALKFKPSREEVESALRHNMLFRLNTHRPHQRERPKELRLECTFIAILGRGGNILNASCR